MDTVSGRVGEADRALVNGAASVSALPGFDPSREAYLFTNGWWMMRQPERPFWWALHDADNNPVDTDKYRHDLMPRHKLTIAEHYDWDRINASAIEARRAATTGAAEDESAAIAQTPSETTHDHR